MRGLFSGEILETLLFPYPDPLPARDPAEASVVNRLVGALRTLERTGVIDAARFDADQNVPDEVLHALAGIGMFGLTIPREYGGLGLSNSGYARVFGELAAIDGSLAVIVGVHCGLGSKAIVLYGTDDQKQRYLPQLARAEIFAAYALTEPETGSDAQNLQTTAVRTEDGSGWVLNGRKLWIGGKAGKAWTGRVYITGKYRSPAWSPPADVKRDNPRLPNVIPGGSPSNPMGAAALTLSGGGEYAIHGTNAPNTVGGFVSYGCFRMHNKDVADLFNRVSVGTQVVVEQ
jgi:hypothetical protein